MDKKIIFFDVDGTLYAPGQEGISEKVKNAIIQTRDKGHLCFIASGRPDAFISQYIKEMGFDGYVLANGAHIKYRNKDLKVRYIDYNCLKEIIDKLKKKNIEYVFETPTYSYIDKKQEKLLHFYSKCNIDFCHFCYEFDEDEVMHKTVKIEVWINNEDELKYVQSCHDSFIYELHPDHHSMEIYTKDVSKAIGILDVLNLLDISVENSLCFGDGTNDVEMFETVGHSIAMGNAIDVIKKKQMKYV